MAEIVRARDTSQSDRIVAIKRILPHLCGDEHYRAMFLDEARVLAELRHPSIVQELESGEIEGTPYIALEYVRGQDAREVFLACERAGQPLPLGIACYVIARVCEGLQYVHDRKDPEGKSLAIVHRDVSLQNLLIGYDGEVKLTDFGIAVSSVNEVRTEAGIVKGKFGYMSPEQVRGAKLDARSDVFAVGVCLYELLTGERLFSGDNDYKALERVRQADVPRPSSRNRQIPSSLERIVMKALAKSPRDRYATANDLRRALQGFLSEANLFIERADLGGYLRALFEQDYRAGQPAPASSQAAPEQPSAEPARPSTLSPEELFGASDQTVVAPATPGPVELDEPTGADLAVFGALSAPMNHSVVPEAPPPESPLPQSGEAHDGSASQAGPAADRADDSSSQFDMDWDEHEPTTISRGFDAALLAPSGAASPRDPDAPAFSQPEHSPHGSEEEDQRTSSQSVASALSQPRAQISPRPISDFGGGQASARRQRSVPTLEIRKPRDRRFWWIGMASFGAAVTVFLAVYVLGDREGAGIRIDTEPPDATVYIDGQRLRQDRSPFVATKLSLRQKHTVVVERAGHTSWSTTLTLPGGGVFTLPTVRLEKVPQPELEEAAPPEEHSSAPEQPAAAAPAEPEPSQKPAATSSRARSSTTQRRSGSSRATRRSADGSEAKATGTAARTGTTAGEGTLRINSRPWSQVTLDGVRIGTTPILNHKVSAGTHTLTLENPEFGVKKQVRVTVRRGQTVTRVLTLTH